MLQRLLAAGALAAIGLLAWWAAGALFTGTVPAPSTRVNAETGADAWALAGRDAAHTAALPIHDGYAGREAWRVRLQAPVRGGLAVAGGQVFLGTDDGKFVAFDAADGATLWERLLTLPTTAAPAVTPGVVYVASRSGELLALDRSDGGELWRFDVGSPLAAAPIAHDGAVYAGSWDGELFALDAADGRVLWTLQAEGGIVTPPAIAGELMALASGDRTVSVIDLATGRTRLNFDAGQTLTVGPVFAGGMALVSTAKGRLIAVDPEAVEYLLERGARFWRRQLFLWGLQSQPPAPKGLAWERRPSRNSALSPGAVSSGAVYVASRDGRLHAFAASDGAPLWEYDTEAQIQSSPAVAGDFVYVGNDAGEVYAVDRHSGEASNVFVVGGAVRGQLAATESVLYVTTSSPPALIALR